MYSRVFRLWSRSTVLLLLMCGLASANSANINASKYQELKREANDIAVSIVTSGLSCTCARFAEDMRNIINDLRPNGLRVLPVLGVGGLQNIKDMLFLKGIDMGVVDQDNLKILKRQDPVLYANLEQRIQYITKLYNAEFHVLARNDIKSFSDLKGKRVNFNLKDSQTEVTSDNVFSMLQLGVIKSNYDNDVAIKKVIAGDLDAMIILTGAPQAALAKLKKADGVHFLSLDVDTYQGPNLDKVYEEYLPAELTNETYPNLIDPGQSVPTIANRAVLAVYVWPENTERYNKLVKFVGEFFAKIDQFKDPSRHPKWKEVNLAAEVPGWTRFKPAQQLLDGRSVATQHPDTQQGELGDIQLAFEQFLERYAQTNGQKQLTPKDKQALFAQFKLFLEAQNNRTTSR